MICDQDGQDLVTLNRLDEFLLPRTTIQRVRVAAITRADARRRIHHKFSKKILYNRYESSGSNKRRMKRVGSLT